MDTTTDVLRAAALDVTRTFDLTSVLDKLLEHLAQLVPYDTASVMLLDDDGRLAVRAIRGYEHGGDPALTRDHAFDVGEACDQRGRHVGPRRLGIVVGHDGHPTLGGGRVPLDDLAVGGAVGERREQHDRAGPGCIATGPSGAASASARRVALSCRC